MSKDTTLFSGHGWARLTRSGPGARAERKVWGWERVLPGQRWLGGLLGWFLIAAERVGLPVRRQKRTQEIRGLSFLHSQGLLLHTDSYFYFCKSLTLQRRAVLYMRRTIFAWTLELFSIYYSEQASAKWCPSAKNPADVPSVFSDLWNVCTHNTFMIITSSPSPSFSCRRREAQAFGDHSLNRLKLICSCQIWYNRVVPNGSGKRGKHVLSPVNSIT